MAMSICVNCGGVIGCPMFGECKEHFHCDCNMINKGANKRRFEAKNS